MTGLFFSDLLHCGIQGDTVLITLNAVCKNKSKRQVEGRRLGGGGGHKLRVIVPDRAAVCWGLDRELRADHLRRSPLLSAPAHLDARTPEWRCWHCLSVLSTTSLFYVLCMWASSLPPSLDPCVHRGKLPLVAEHLNVVMKGCSDSPLLLSLLSSTGQKIGQRFYWNLHIQRACVKEEKVVVGDRGKEEA